MGTFLVLVGLVSGGVQGTHGTYRNLTEASLWETAYYLRDQCMKPGQDCGQASDQLDLANWYSISLDEKGVK